MPPLPLGFLDYSSDASEERELHEAHVPTQPSAPSAHSRISRAHEHESRSPHSEAPPRQGPEAPCRFLTIPTPLPSGGSHRAGEIRQGPPAALGAVIVSQTLRRDQRIRRRAEYQRVHRKAVRTHGRFLTLLTLPNDGSLSRLGIAAPRRLGGATRRNRAKRLVRELFRRSEARPGLDVVVLPRVELLTAAFESLEEDYRSTLARSARRR